MEDYTCVTFVSERCFDQEQFAAWIEGRQAQRDLRYELLDGFIVQQPPASWPHGEIAAEICRRLANHVREHRLGRVFDSSQGFELPNGHTVEPDVSFVSTASWERAEPRRGAFLSVVPELVVEVLSPSTRERDREQKLRIYAEAGVREYWIVEDATRSIEQYLRIEGEQRFGAARVFGPLHEVESLVLASLAVPVGAVFPE